MPCKESKRYQSGADNKVTQRTKCSENQCPLPPYTPAPEVQKAKRKRLESNKGRKQKEKENKINQSLVRQQSHIKLNLSMRNQRR